MESHSGESENLILQEAERAATLKAKLENWEQNMLRPVELRELDGQEQVWFDYYLQ